MTYKWRHLGGPSAYRTQHLRNLYLLRDETLEREYERSQCNLNAYLVGW